MKGTLTKEVMVEVGVVDALDAVLVSTISKFDGMADAAGYRPGEVYIDEAGMWVLDDQHEPGEVRRKATKEEAALMKSMLTVFRKIAKLHGR